MIGFACSVHFITWIHKMCGLCVFPGDGGAGGMERYRVSCGGVIKVFWNYIVVMVAQSSEYTKSH